MEARKSSKVEWLFYMILLPLMFTVILTGILMTFLGYDVKGIVLDWGNQIPYVEKITPGTHPKMEARKEDEKKALEKQIDDLTQRLQEQAVVAAAQDEEAEAKEEQIGELKQAINDLQIQLERERSAREFEKETERKESKKTTARAYAEMSAGKAAPILAKMPTDEVLSIFQELSIAERSAILAKFDPEIAAKLTSELLRRTERSP